MSVIYILWLRELKRYSRSRAQIVASLGQPLLYLLALGFGLGPVFQKAGQGSYLQFIAPGVIAMTVLFRSIFSGIGLLWDRQFGFLKETLVAPVPRIQIMLGRTLGGATVAMIQGTLVLTVCFIAGFRPAQRQRASWRSLFMALIAIVFAALGTAIGSIAEEHAGLSDDHELPGDADLLSFGRAVSADEPSDGLQIATQLDPLSYGIDGLRGALMGVSHFSPAVDFSVLGVVAMVFLALGAYAFSKIQI